MGPLDHPVMLHVGARVKGWTVTMPLAQPDGWHELLAEDANGGCVVLRVPPDLDGVAAIRQEADLAKQHTHESLVQTVGLVEHNGWPVQVLEHVDGLTLEQLVELTGPLSPAAVCRVGRQVALALVELHDRAPVVAHGSLGPDRVIIDDGGNARLVDVGVARPTSRKRYLSPERRRAWARPSSVDDIWALGVLLADSIFGEARIVADKLDLLPISRAAVPERLVDALSVLVAPENARIRNASAAVRIFTEVALRLAAVGEGDGTTSLRAAMRSARELSRPPDPLPPVVRAHNDDVTQDDVDITQPSPRFLGPPPVERVEPRVERNEPKTILMEGGTVEMAELRRMAAIAQDAATRALPTRAPVTPRGQRDERSEPTERVHRSRVAGTPAEKPAVKDPTGALDDDELAAVTGHQRVVAGAAVGGLSVLALVVALVAWLG